MSDHYLFPILSKFDRLTWRSDDDNLGECRCPAHEDSTNSLHVTIKHCTDGQIRLMLKCHAGCQNKDILRALGEGFSSLFPDRTTQKKLAGDSGQSAGKVRQSGASIANPSPPSAETSPESTSENEDQQKRKFAAAYDYRDSTGVIQHQTIRWEPKFFTQRRRAEPNKTYTIGNKEYKSFRDPFGNWWINTLKGIEPLIYDLPRILKAPLNKVIFLCEGEKDAENLKRQFNVYATTVPMGSGKWRKSYRDYFIGRRVIIIPDMDKPRSGQTDPAANAGYDGARKIAAELIAVCTEVRICYLPNLFDLSPKWDLSDWLAAGGTKPQFFEACNASEILGIGHPGLVPAGSNAATAEPAEPPHSSAEKEGGFGNNSSHTPTPNEAILLPTAIGKGHPLPNGKVVRLDEFNQPIRGQIRNVIETADGFEPISMRAVMHNFLDVTDNWPKRCGGALFYVDSENSIDPNFFPIQWLNSSSSLFGWAGSYSGMPVLFARNGGGASKEEVFAEMQRTAEPYESVEQYPHEPRIPSVYYACKPQEEWKSEKPGCLYELISRFSPAEPVDFDLIIAFLMTLVWGGGGGQRPLFVITSDSGRGAGKTTFASLLTSLVGGSLQLSAQADDQIIRQRLLSPEGLEKRTVLLDNVKSLKFSWAEFEALITSEKISGKQMYVGEASRVNRITYVVTINGPSLSTDLAERSITIKLGKPKHEGDWLKDTADFIAKYKTSIIAELLELLQHPQTTLEANTRWGNWEKNVLCRMSSAEICQAAIKSRQKELDAEQDESNLIMEYFEKQLLKNGIRTDVDKTFIPSGTAAEWLNEALGEKHSKSAACRILTQKINEGKLIRLDKAKNPERIDGTVRKERGFWWIPEGWNEESGGVIRPGGMATFDVDDFVLF